MKEDYTHITIVLDRSWSMGEVAGVWDETVGGVEGTIKDQKKNKDQCTLSLYNFDNVIEQNLDFVDIQKAPESIKEFGIYPRGGTALYDAIGRATVETGKKLAAIPESLRPGRVIVIIQTDGEENQSREYTSAKIAELVKEHEEKYNWQFQFVGASQGAVLEATKKLGFRAANTAFYDIKNSKGTFDILNSKLALTRSAGYADYSSGVTMAFSAAERSVMSDGEEKVVV